VFILSISNTRSRFYCRRYLLSIRHAIVETKILVKISGQYTLSRRHSGYSGPEKILLPESITEASDKALYQAKSSVEINTVIAVS